MKKKILVIDDEPSLVTALVDKFTRAGYEMITAEDGKIGLKVALEEKPDLILLDIIMPVMDGVTMLSLLRKDHWGKNAKVILLTNLSDPGRVTKPIIASASGHLVKADWKLSDVVKIVGEKLV